MSKAYGKSIVDVIGRQTVHPFPARMAPGIVLELLKYSRRQLRVLDPMMGSGTVIATARARGHRAFGCDLDPLSVLISRVWTTPTEVERVLEKARDVLDRAIVAYDGTRSASAFPRSANPETKRFLKYWFDGYARRELLCLSEAIGRVRCCKTKNVLWCAFSRLIISKQAGASRAMDLAHSRPHRKFKRAPISPFDKFLLAVERVVDNCIDASARKKGPDPALRIGDARSTHLERGSIDLIVTSPPYLNAIDYIRCSKFSLVWMGHQIDELRELRSDSVGSEVGLKSEANTKFLDQLLKKLKLTPALSSRDEAILRRYICDMQQAVAESARVLVPHGRAVYVVGENTIRGTYIRNSKIVCELAAQAGLKFQNRRVRELPPDRRYLPPPSSLTSSSDGIDSRMRREVILAFKKPKKTNSINSRV